MTHLNPTHTNILLRAPAIMGILNVTPDSFSDGGKFTNPKSALDHAIKMTNDGASIIDIGAESTRPNAPFVSEQEELARLVPIVTLLRLELPNILLSIDTSRPAVIQKMHDLGANIWNDVRGLRADGAMAMAAKLNMPTVIMHSRGDLAMPQTMDNLAIYDDVVNEVAQALLIQAERAVSLGLARQNVILDIGMGFAKNYEHHLLLMQNLTKINQLFAKNGFGNLFGISRKRFVGEILARKTGKKTKACARDDASNALALIAWQHGAQIVRTHDVAGAHAMLAVYLALTYQPNS